MSLQEGFTDLATLPTTLQDLTHSTMESRMGLKGVTAQLAAFKSEFDNMVCPSQASTWIDLTVQSNAWAR